MNKERPILFSTAMVNAILSGEKTQTRRSVKARSYIADVVNGIAYEMTDDDIQPIKCPYGQPGDILWVRETFQHTKILNINPEDENYGFVYRADGNEWEDIEGWKWKSPLFMPKSASRISLRITDVQIERLHDISENDAKAEGADYAIISVVKTSAKNKFHTLWVSINGNESWKSNPWVWVIKFEPIKK